MTRHLPESDRREQILNAARDVFIEEGYLQARVQDVARRAGLSKGAVYFYYPSKRDIFMALIHQEHEDTYAFLARAETDPRPAAALLVELGQKYLDYFAPENPVARFFLMITEQGIRDEEIREELQAVHQHFVEAATRLVAQGIAEGAFRKTDPVAVAILVKAIIDGLAGQAAIGIAHDRAMLAREGLAVILQGLMVQGRARTP
ncbi:MAG: TetR/AcrR family transcriptional regulator [Deltaproteobacteria bacterium]|nr:TetR/AcrR family transcriptional regulator [Deltaproteobacteria bacterium]